MNYATDIRNMDTPQRERKTDTNRAQVSVSADKDVLPEVTDIISEFKANAMMSGMLPSALLLKCLAFYNQGQRLEKTENKAESKAQESKEKGK